jgi:hypothetical protein
MNVYVAKSVSSIEPLSSLYQLYNLRYPFVNVTDFQTSVLQKLLICRITPQVEPPAYYQVCVCKLVRLTYRISQLGCDNRNGAN